MRKHLLALSLLAAAPAVQAANVIPTKTVSISWPGTQGVLRAGSPRGPGSTPSSALALVDGVFQPEGTQWNNGSLWWDEDPSVNASPIQFVLTLSGSFTIDRLVVQADDNDDYLVEYWDGSAFVPVFNAAAVFSFGLITRDSGTIAPITTNSFRLSASAGDKYYGVGEFQAFEKKMSSVVPEAATWAMMITGFGLVGAAMRRQRKAVRQTAN